MLGKCALERGVASANPTWSNRTSINPSARPMEFAMVAATATTRFLPFLAPAEESALLPIAVLGVGEFFGEMSCVDGTPTSARVIADEPTQLRVIDTATLDTLN